MVVEKEIENLDIGCFIPNIKDIKNLSVKAEYRKAEKQGLRLHVDKKQFGFLVSMKSGCFRE